MKKLIAAVMAVALVACMMTAPAGAITTGKWEISQGTQDLIDKTLDEVPEYQPEEPDAPEEQEGPAAPVGPCNDWADSVRQAARDWFARWDVRHR